MARSALLVGNCSGFYGDRFAAMQEMLEGGPLDVITGDYLAELTMLILGRDRMKDERTGYAKTFLRQLKGSLTTALAKNVKIVVNAGGLNPAGLADAVRALAGELGASPVVAHVEGDDLMARASELGLGHPLTANAYLGGWGIAECLKAGANIVITGRVTDASLVVGAAAAHFGWKRDEWNKLAGAVVAGHVLECGAQTTGGNFAFFREITMGHLGFPIAEIEEDGSCIITKHPNTGGAVNVDTVRAQIVYEIQGPRYAGPDVTTRFDTMKIIQDGTDRVRIHDATGEPPPPSLKVCLNHVGGFRNEVSFILVGLEMQAKANLIRQQMEAQLTKKPADISWNLTRTDHEDAPSEAQAAALFRVIAKDKDKDVVGRAFSGAAIEIGLASYPGFALTAPPGDASMYGVYSAKYVPQEAVPHVAVLPDGTRVAIPPTTPTKALEPLAQIPVVAPPAAASKTVRAPIGSIIGARSGDKGGNANIGVWARSEPAYRWLVDMLSVAKLKELLPEAAPLTVERHLLPEIWAINFVIEGILGEGVSSSPRFDPQAKGLGEWLRSRHVEIPSDLMPTTA